MQKGLAEMEDKPTLSRTLGWTMFGLGATALAASIVYVSSILAFVGLGLLFWGIVLTYVRTEEYVQAILLDATVTPSLVTLIQIMKGLDYNGKAVYLPPRYLRNPETSKVYIPKQEGRLPPPEQIQQEESQLFIRNPQGMLLTPPGAELTKLFEKTLNTSFIKVDLEYLQQNLPKLFIEDLEIAQNFEIEIENNSTVRARIENTVYGNLYKGNTNPSNLYGNLGCPMSGAIACALAKATGKPITIEKQQISGDRKNLNIEYHMLE